MYYIEKKEKQIQTVKWFNALCRKERARSRPSCRWFFLCVWKTESSRRFDSVLKNYFLCNTISFQITVVQMPPRLDSRKLKCPY